MHAERHVRRVRSATPRVTDGERPRPDTKAFPTEITRFVQVVEGDAMTTGNEYCPADL